MRGPALNEEVDYAALPILGDLAPEVLAHLRPHCRVVTFADDDIILTQGAQNDHLHFLLAGRAEVHFNLNDRSEPIEVATGQMFGELSVIDQRPTSAFVIAAGPCRVLLLPASVFWSDIMTLPGVARSVMRRLSHMLRTNADLLVRTMQERLDHAAMQRELRLAHDIQMSMLRRTEGWFADRTDLRIAALIEPARQVGGDFYDAFLLDRDRLVLAIGDVAGKGISSALFMVRGLTLLRSPATQWVSLEQTLHEANRILAQDNEAAMFLTLFMAELDLRTGVLDYINFGHTWPIVRSPTGQVAFQEVTPGVMFGLMPDAKGGAGRLHLQRGATLLVYSDGVTEAEDAARRQLGSQGLRATVATADTDDPAALVRAVADAVSHHAGTAEQSDDITLLAVTWDGAPGNDDIVTP